MDITEIIPQKPEFKLEATGNTYQLRPPSLEDNAFFKAKFGDDATVSKALKDVDWAVLSVMILRLMVNRKDFAPQEIEEETFEGLLEKKHVLAPERFRRLIVSENDKGAAMTALIAALTAGNPPLQKAVGEAIKKSLAELKSLTESPTGLESSTSSQANMDGPLNTSENLPIEKLTSS